jgi:hypothetical protein
MRVAVNVSSILGRVALGGGGGGGQRRVEATSVRGNAEAMSSVRAKGRTARVDGAWPGERLGQRDDWEEGPIGEGQARRSQAARGCHLTRIS